MPYNTAPRSYAPLQGWWMYLKGNMPTRSVFPKAQPGTPNWILGDIPPQGSYGIRSTQGWKLHVCCMPLDIDRLYDALNRYLRRNKLGHKWFPFPEYRKTQVSTKLANTQQDTKALVIYPNDPRHLQQIVRAVDIRIQSYNRRHPDDEIRPFPGGVRGDLLLGKTGCVFCRYGAFEGPLAMKKKLYDNINDAYVADPRFITPYPNFIRQIPAEIRAC